jgi:hypothetical protein
LHVKYLPRSKEKRRGVTNEFLVNKDVKFPKLDRLFLGTYLLYLLIHVLVMIGGVLYFCTQEDLIQAQQSAEADEERLRELERQVNWLLH